MKPSGRAAILLLVALCQVQLAHATNPEDDAWEQVNCLDKTSVETFLEQFPTSKHTEKATLAIALQDALEEIRVSKINPRLTIPFETLGEDWENWSRLPSNTLPSLGAEAKGVTGYYIQLEEGSENIVQEGWFKALGDQPPNIVIIPNTAIHTLVGFDADEPFLYTSKSIAGEKDIQPSFHYHPSPVADGSIIAFRTNGIKMGYIGNIIIVTPPSATLYFGVLEGVGLVYLFGEGEVVVDQAVYELNDRITDNYSGFDNPSGNELQYGSIKQEADENRDLSLMNDLPFPIIAVRKETDVMYDLKAGGTPLGLWAGSCVKLPDDMYIPIRDSSGEVTRFEKESFLPSGITLQGLDCHLHRRPTAKGLQREFHFSNDIDLDESRMLITGRADKSCSEIQLSAIAYSLVAGKSCPSLYNAIENHLLDTCSLSRMTAEDIKETDRYISSAISRELEPVSNPLHVYRNNSSDVYIVLCSVESTTIISKGITLLHAVFGVKQILRKVPIVKRDYLN